MFFLIFAPILLIKISQFCNCSECKCLLFEKALSFCNKLKFFIKIIIDILLFLFLYCKSTLSNFLVFIFFKYMVYGYYMFDSRIKNNFLIMWSIFFIYAMSILRRPYTESFCYQFLSSSLVNLVFNLLLFRKKISKMCLFLDLIFLPAHNQQLWPLL